MIIKKEKRKAYDKARRLTKDFFKKTISSEKRSLKPFLNRMKSKSESNAINAMVMGVSYRHIETLKLVEGLTDSLLFLAYETGSRISSLGTAIEEISKKSGIEVSSITKQVEELKGTVKSPMIEQVVGFIQLMENEAQRRKKAMEGYIE